MFVLIIHEFGSFSLMTESFNENNKRKTYTFEVNKKLRNCSRNVCFYLRKKRKKNEFKEHMLCLMYVHGFNGIKFNEGIIINSKPKLL